MKCARNNIGNFILHNYYLNFDICSERISAYINDSYTIIVIIRERGVR